MTDQNTNTIVTHIPFEQGRTLEVTTTTTSITTARIIGESAAVDVRAAFERSRTP